MTTFQQKVYAIVKAIPRGQVLTYRQVAERLGQPGAARAVGNALNKNYHAQIPCHRVIRSDRHLGGYNRGSARKRTSLRQEGFYGVRQ